MVQIMKAPDQTFADFLHVLRRRARPATAAAMAVLLGMTYLAFSLPAVYESSANLLIEHPEIPQDVLGGEGAEGYVEQRLQRVRQRVMTPEHVQELITRHKLYQADGENLSPEEMFTRFNESVIVTPEVTGVIDPRSMRTANLTYAFAVSFQYDDPEVARDVADSLAELFITSNAEQAKDASERAIAFLRAEADRLQTDLREREDRLTQLRQSHAGDLPGDREENQNRAGALERDLARVDDDLRSARARKDLLEAQLRDTPRNRPVLDETGQAVILGADRLAAAQQELVAALAKYSEDHPDVRRLRREIASLSADPSVTSASSVPTNPIYEQLQTQIDAADVAIRDLLARRYDMSSTLARLQSAIYQSPEYEQQYTDLVRDYELVKAQYEQMRARETAAVVAQKAAGSQAGESYVLVGPAQVPATPSEPDRVALMFLGFVLAIAAGLGTASLLNSADSTVRGSADIAALIGAPPLGHIPTMRSPTELRRRRLGNIALATGFLTVVAFVVNTIM
jgi:polysaccharide chain length determinant protein (PEP-CTERM system associated)